MTTGLSCLVDPHSWDQLLLDSEASLRLVDTALSDLLSAPALEGAPFGEFVPAFEMDKLFVNGELANGRRPPQGVRADALLRSGGDGFRSRIRGPKS
jgi:hypothetical protein